MRKTGTKDKRRFRDALSNLFRGFRTAYKIDRGIFIFLTLDNLFSAVTPYVGLYAASLILTGLTSDEADETGLYIKAVVCVLITFAVGMARLPINKEREIRNTSYVSRVKIFLNNIDFTQMYENVDNPEIVLLGRRARYFDGLYGIPAVYGKFIRTAINLAAAFSVSLGVAFMRTDGDGGILERFIDSPLSMLALLVIIGASVWVNFLMGRYSDRKNYEYDWDNERLFGAFNYYTDTYTSAGDSGMDCRVYGIDKLIAAELEKRAARPPHIIEKMKLDCAKNELSNLMSFTVSASLYVYAALKAVYGAIETGEFILYSGALIKFANALRDVGNFIGTVYHTDKFLQDAFRYIDLPNTMYTGTLTVPKRDDNEYYVEFRDVSFRYPNSENYALRHVNIKFKIGERLAVVGMNGSGKTTFIKLLCRLYDPTEGEILLNGVDVRKFACDEYMRIFSVVFQDFRLLAFSLGQNVAASADYDGERVVSCLRQAGFGGRLSEMQDGIETCLYRSFDENGVEISGGEGQKIALARALYKDAPFIILDEPTAALDPVSEYEVYSGFNGIVGGKTAVYISHRLASCRFCDEIAVFDDGELVQFGSHDALVADENGKYHELWNAQAQYYTKQPD